MELHWTVAIDAAKRAKDVTFQEWCDLYIPPVPNSMVVQHAAETALLILLRNKMITPGVSIDLTINGPHGR